MHDLILWKCRLVGTWKCVQWEGMNNLWWQYKSCPIKKKGLCEQITWAICDTNMRSGQTETKLHMRAWRLCDEYQYEEGEVARAPARPPTFFEHALFLLGFISCWESWDHKWTELTDTSHMMCTCSLGTSAGNVVCHLALGTLVMMCPKARFLCSR
jgi:hypothetical protein